MTVKDILDKLLDDPAVWVAWNYSVRDLRHDLKLLELEQMKNEQRWMEICVHE